MDEIEKNKNQCYQDDYNFLQDDNFIRWRLLRTIELNDYWNDFLKERPYVNKAFHEAIARFDALQLNRYPLSATEKKKIYRTVLHKISRREKIRRISLFSSIAAVSIAAALFLFNFIFFKERDQTPFKENIDTIIGQTLPDEEIYLISGGAKINIAHKSQISLTEGGKALVIDSADARKELLLSSVQFNKLVVPFGKRTNLTLSDGTKVWLNSGTLLEFPAEFVGDRREIHLNGEIFIEVAHNMLKPFIVHAQDMEIYVYGTSFNVSAYQNDSKKTIVLVDGKVKIETAVGHMDELKPNEKIEVKGENIIKEHVNVSEYISWTKGILEFENTPVSEILKKIGRYYNVQFESSQDIMLNEQSCTGKLFLSNNLDSVMTSVSVISSTVYYRENNIIHITKK